MSQFVVAYKMMKFTVH